MPRPPAGLSAAGMGPPLVLVERTGADGNTTSAALLRADEGLVLLDNRGRRHRLRSDDPFLAVAGCRSLRDLRPNEATAVSTSEDGPSSGEMARLLRLCQPEVLATEDPVPFPGDDDYLDGWADMTVPANVGRRRVVINGQDWVAVVPGPGMRPRLLPRDTDQDRALLPVFRDDWAHFAAISEDSMVSGYSVWRLGLLDDNLLGEYDGLDEAEPDLTVRRRHRSQELDIARWLRSLAGARCGIDVVMFAVETLIGDLDQNGTAATLFDHDAPESVVCDIWVGGDPDRLLDALRRIGRGDAIDAIRKPKSAAGRRRAERLAER